MQARLPRNQEVKECSVNQGRDSGQNLAGKVRADPYSPQSGCIRSIGKTSRPTPSTSPETISTWFLFSQNNINQQQLHLAAFMGEET